MKFFKSSKSESGEEKQEDKKSGSTGLFGRLAKTRRTFSNGLLNIFRTSTPIDEQLFEEIEDQLIIADLGASTSEKILQVLRAETRKQRYTESDQLLQCLQRTMVDILKSTDGDLPEKPEGSPLVILMVGVNGVGKTTTLAKMANQYKDSGHSVMMAACDTFRAAAIEQLQSWGSRLEIPVVAQSHGADAAAVAFDAYSAACARNIDVLLIDTAGRQHTHGDLMEQLKKVKRVLKKTNENIPHEVLLTVDAGNGQNIHSQVENFNEAVEVTGLCITKLDGTAKGGVVISVVEKFGLPVRYVGVGEGVDDLKPFSPDDFIAALLPELSDRPSGEDQQ